MIKHSLTGRDVWLWGESPQPNRRPAFVEILVRREDPVPGLG